MRLGFWLVLVTLCSNVLAGSQVAKGHEAAADANTQAPGKTSGVVPPTHVIIDQPYPTISTKPESPKEQDSPQEKPLPRFVQYTKPEWVIVYVTAVYAFIAWLTLRAINKQATSLRQQVEDARKANADTLAAMNRQAAVMDQQIRLQEAAMTQWVSIPNWRVNIQERPGPLSPQPKMLRVEFDIMNESNYPLTIDAVIGFFGRLPNATRLEIMGDAVLFPRKPYTCGGVLRVTEEQAREYAEGALRIAVHGVIAHVGVSKQRSPLMAIHGNLVCGQSIRAWLEYESFSMVEEREDGGQEAN
jgi:hypothetical protein